MSTDPNNELKPPIDREKVLALCDAINERISAAIHYDPHIWMHFSELDPLIAAVRELMEENEKFRARFSGEAIAAEHIAELEAKLREAEERCCARDKASCRLHVINEATCNTCGHGKGWHQTYGNAYGDDFTMCGECSSGRASHSFTESREPRG